VTTISAEVLEKVLSSIEVRSSAARRVVLEQGDIAPLPTRTVSLVYVVEGSVHGRCQQMFTEGDAFLTLGQAPFAVQSELGARVMIADLQLSGTGGVFTDVLPELLTVTGFAALEPAAAALAGNLGTIGRPERDERSGDPVICRIMATTVLLSLIRAWVANGCAPAGWPSRSNDPFLDRVVAAIHDEPGREWTVESLAGIGAMSRSVFAARFHDAIGRSPASYVTEVRMQTAKRMLQDGRAVSETSRSLGYSSDEGFSRAFRRATGMTPSTWRAAQTSLISA
jgi:AraC-like DNA-binding protein